MNYAQSRQRKDSGLWDWTVMRDKQVRQASPCTDECHHVAQEEADRHFYDYSLAQVTETTWQSMEQCAVPGCRGWTQKSLGNSFHLAFPQTFLCDAHRNRDELRKLHPFKSSIELIYS